jgi:hypothetical protein
LSRDKLDALNRAGAHKKPGRSGQGIIRNYNDFVDDSTSGYASVNF